MINRLLEIKQLGRTGVINFTENPFVAMSVDGNICVLPNIHSFRAALPPTKYGYLGIDDDADFLAVAVGDWLEHGDYFRAAIGDLKSSYVNEALMNKLASLLWDSLKAEIASNSERSLMYFVISRYYQLKVKRD